VTSLRSGSATDIGRNPRRTINQDMILESSGIFAVADGMGGHLGGEVASLTAIEALRRNFAPEEGATGLEQAIVAAHEAVVTQSNSSDDLRDMGTTLAVVALVDGDDGDELLAVANNGDSRIYLLRDGELSQLTDDHSLPEELFRRGQLTKAEAAVDPRRNIVTRVIGPSFGEGPDIQNLVPYAGDRIVLCSDGLYNEVDDDAIARLLRTVADPGDAARALVDQANANGGGDNISVIVVDVVDDGDRAARASTSAGVADRKPPAPDRARTASPSGLMTADERNAQLRRLSRDDDGRDDRDPWDTDREIDVHEPSRRVTGRVIVFLLLLLVVLGAGAGAVGFYARGAYFVGLDEGRVAIFKGRPGGLLWFAPTVEERTDLTAGVLPESRADDVANGHEFATLDEAERFVANLEDEAGLSSTTTGPGSSASTTTLPTTTTTAAATPTSTP
jgi:protein phosphatase